jgi:hypothetical protein
MIKSKMGWMDHAAHMRETKNRYKMLVETPEWKRALGRPKHR